MGRNIFLPCVVVALYLDQTIASENKTERSQPLQKSILSFIDAIESAGKTPVKVSKTVVQGVAGKTNAALGTVVKAQSDMLDGGVQTFKHGVDGVANLIGILQLPGLPQVVNTGSKAINLAADLTHLGGQAILNAESTILNRTTDAVSSAAETGANVIGSRLEGAANLTKLGVNTGVNLMEDAAARVQTVDKTLDQFSALAQIFTGFLKLPNQY